MSLRRTVLQTIGIILLIPSVAILTLRYEYRDHDGPSILFPGGELISGELHTGPEPDWRFTQNVPTIELQLQNPTNSRLIWIHESDGKIYVGSGYMNSILGGLWKHWAVQADAGNGLAVMRINGVRYERQLVRINSGDVLDGIAAASSAKYGGAASRQAIESGDTWIFELAPRAGQSMQEPPAESMKAPIPNELISNEKLVNEKLVNEKLANEKIVNEEQDGEEK